MTKTNVPIQIGSEITFNDLVPQQLKRNKLPTTGSLDIPKGKK